MLEESNIILLSPPYSIIRQVVPSSGNQIEHRAFGQVTVRHQDWSDQHLDNAIAVVLWMRDGKPIWAKVAPTRKRVGLSSDFPAIIACELKQGDEVGYPILLLFKDGRFVPPDADEFKPEFQRVMVTAHLGSVQQFQVALAKLTGSELPERSYLPTLTWMIPETGRLNIAEAFWSSYPDLDRESIIGYSTLWRAGFRDRVDIVESLLAQAKRRKLSGEIKNYLPSLVGTGALSAGIAMVRDGHRKDANGVISLAFWFEEWDAVKELLRLKIRDPLDRVSDGSLIRAVEIGDVELLELLLKNRMSPNVKTEDSNLYIAATKSGNFEALEILLKAKRRPKVNVPDARGSTALDLATVKGDISMVELLQKFGAKHGTAEVRMEELQSEADRVIYGEHEVEVRPILVTPAVISHPRLLVAQQVPGQLSLTVSPVPTATGLASVYRTQREATLVYGERDIVSNLSALVSVVIESNGAVGDYTLIYKTGRMDLDYLDSAVTGASYSPGRVAGEAVATRISRVIFVENQN